MGLAPDIGLGSIVLGIERVEVLLEPLVGRDPGVDRAADRLWLVPVFMSGALFDCLSRRPKKRGPFQRVPVMAKATLERLL